MTNTFELNDTSVLPCNRDSESPEPDMVRSLHSLFLIQIETVLN